MSEAFARTTRSLQLDHHRLWSVALGVGFVLVAAWGLWMGLARVPVRAVSQSARIEAAGVPREVQASLAGTVTEVAIALGDRVEQGQLLVLLDDSSARAALAEATALRDGLTAQLERLTAARQALSEVGATDESARTSAAAAARSAAQQAELAARQARDEAARAADLARSGAISAQELERARAESQRLELETRVRQQVVLQLSSEVAGARESGQVELGRLEQELANLQGQLQSAQAQLAAAELQLERHRLVAPTDGVVGALSVRDVGAVLAVGESVATVVPAGELHVVASFSPAAALGRIRPSQPAQMRLDGFPWTAYGSLPARVERVADEPLASGPDAGQIRVELSLHPGPDWRVPLQHGLPGRVEVEVERLSPGALILQTVGGG
jgi:multidrug resistance efflux pump